MSKIRNVTAYGLIGLISLYVRKAILLELYYWFWHPRFAGRLPCLFTNLYVNTRIPIVEDRTAKLGIVRYRSYCQHFDHVAEPKRLRYWLW